MSDIPQDIQKTARSVFSGIASIDWVEAEILIARALLAERERCAVYHDELAAEHDEVAESDEWHRKCSYMHRRAAKFIRLGPALSQDTHSLPSEDR